MNDAFWAKVGVIYGRLISAVPCGYVTLEHRADRFVVLHWRTRVGPEIFHATQAVDDLDVLYADLSLEQRAHRIADTWLRQFEDAIYRCSPGKGRPSIENKD